MAWVDYDQELLDQFKEDGVLIIGPNQGHDKTYVARTFYEDHYIPGYAVNGVGYFVSKEQQPFQTSNFQVLIGTFFYFFEISQNEPRGLVADDEVDESERIKIGSFFIEGKRLYGKVDNRNTCYINFDGEVYCKVAPEFQIPFNTVH